MDRSGVLEQLSGVAGLEGAGRLVFALVKARNTWHVDLPAPFQVVRSVLMRVEVHQETHGDHLHMLTAQTAKILRLDRMFDQLVDVWSESGGVAALVTVPAVDVHIILLQHSCRPNMNTR